MMKYSFMSFTVALLLLSLSGCTDYKDKHLEFINDAESAIAYYERSDLYSAKRLSEQLIEKYPQRFEPYFMFAAFNAANIVPNKNFGILDDRSQNIVRESIEVGKKGLDLYENISSQQEKLYLMSAGGISGITSYATLLYDFGFFEESIAVYERYYDISKYVEHPQYRYYIIQYAGALAYVDRLEEANAIYIEAFEKNGNDLAMLESYIQFIADHGSLERATKFALGYMQNNGKSGRVMYALCGVYEQMKNSEMSRNCYSELVEYSKSNVVLPEQLQHARQAMSQN